MLICLINEKKEGKAYLSKESATAESPDVASINACQTSTVELIPFAQSDAVASISPTPESDNVL
jgi:hypothetical protein